jgi:hypothetical protein
LKPVPESWRAAFAYLILATSLFLALLSIEAGLRLRYVARPSLASHYPLGRGIAGAHLSAIQSEYETTLQYNRFGFRGRDFALDRSPGETRVLVLGDGFAVGLGVEQEQRFSQLLERQLERAGTPKPVVINAAQIATGPAAYFRNLTEFGVALQPDWVIVAISEGDDWLGGKKLRELGPPLTSRISRDLTEPPGGASGVLSLTYLRKGLAQLLGEPPFLYRPPGDKTLWELVYRSRIDRDFFASIMAVLKIVPLEREATLAKMDPSLPAEFYAGRLNPSLLLEAAEITATEIRGGPPPGEDLYDESDIAGVVDLMKRARDLLAERNIELLVLVIPHVSQICEPEYRAFLKRLGVGPLPRLARLTELRDRLGHELDRAEIRHLDLTRDLRSTPEPAYHIADGRFNALGHRIAARALLLEIAPEL